MYRMCSICIWKMKLGICVGRHKKMFKNIAPGSKVEIALKKLDTWPGNQLHTLHNYYTFFIVIESMKWNKDITVEVNGLFELKPQELILKRRFGIHRI